MGFLSGLSLCGPHDLGGDDNTSVAWGLAPDHEVAEGYCFACDRPVQVQFYRYWAGSEPPWTCQRCGGHDVAFPDRLSRLLLRCIEELERRLAASQEENT
ncbi:MAG: hypothetical protein H8D78_15365 [Chloroflexi bacterium]|nr:hypothetical protein [Chloroflexota bacterium]